MAKRKRRGVIHRVDMQVELPVPLAELQPGDVVVGTRPTPTPERWTVVRIGIRPGPVRSYEITIEMPSEKMGFIGVNGTIREHRPRKGTFRDRLIGSIYNTRTYVGRMPWDPSPQLNPDEYDDRFDEGDSEFAGGIDVDHYRMFHGVPPSEVIEGEVWVPGGMVFIGTGKDVGYGISNPDSFKDGWYVHDFGAGVKIYRRPRRGERADKTWRNFPSQLTNLGWNLGFTYNDGGPNGPMKEVKGSRTKHLAVTPNRKTLVVLDGVGVLYLMEGGAMRVDDWIRD